MAAENSVVLMTATKKLLRLTAGVAVAAVLAGGAGVANADVIGSAGIGNGTLYVEDPTPTPP